MITNTDVELVAKTMWDYRLARDLTEYGDIVDHVPWVAVESTVQNVIRDEARAVLEMLGDRSVRPDRTDRVFARQDAAAERDALRAYARELGRILIEDAPLDCGHAWFVFTEDDLRAEQEKHGVAHLFD